MQVFFLSADYPSLLCNRMDQRSLLNSMGYALIASQSFAASEVFCRLVCNI